MHEQSERYIGMNVDGELYSTVRFLIAYNHF